MRNPLAILLFIMGGIALWWSYIASTAAESMWSTRSIWLLLCGIAAITMGMVTLWRRPRV